MIRTVITPEQQTISINLPKNFIGKQVEVIAFALDDAIEESYDKEETLTLYASEKALANDWLTQEEDKAWQDL